MTARASCYRYGTARAATRGCGGEYQLLCYRPAIHSCFVPMSHCMLARHFVEEEEEDEEEEEEEADEATATLLLQGENVTETQHEVLLTRNADGR